MLGVVRGLGVKVMVGHSVALDEGARKRWVRDDSKHCSGVLRVFSIGGRGLLVVVRKKLDRRWSQGYRGVVCCMDQS